MHTRKLSASLALWLMFLPAVVGAQASSACLDVLPVTLGITSELSSTVPSASIGFQALMQNTSSEVIYDAVLAVDVVGGNPRAVVDRFVVPQHITLFPDSPGKIDFVWKVPGGLSSGTYTVLATLVPADFARAGVYSHGLRPQALREISMTDGAASDAPTLSVSVNGNPYRPHAAAGISAGVSQVTATVTNGTDEPYNGIVTWSLYAPDATLADTPLDESTQTVEIHPGMSSGARYTVSDTAHGAYYLEGKLSVGHVVQYIDIWLERADGEFPFLACVSDSSAPVPLFGTTGRLVLAVLVVSLAVFGWTYYGRRKYGA